MESGYNESIGNIRKTYSFLDESGMLMPSTSKDSNLFGIGLIKYRNPFEINQRLHQYHEQLCSDLKKDDTRIEFSFKGITEKTFPLTIIALDLLKSLPDWKFNCMYFDTKDPQFKSPQNAVGRWNTYVTDVKLLIKNNLEIGEETILIADYLRKPKLSNKRFEYIMTDIPQVYNVLQVISHGVLLVQMADLLLGGFLYNENGYGDKEGYKKRVAKKVIEIKDCIGRERFNTWKVDWSKSSR